VEGSFIDALIAANMYQPADQSFLLELPLKDLEDLLIQRHIDANKNS
jgi:hypothetical protein